MAITWTPVQATGLAAAANTLQNAYNTYNDRAKSIGDMGTKMVDQYNTNRANQFNNAVKLAQLNAVINQNKATNAYNQQKLAQDNLIEQAKLANAWKVAQLNAQTQRDVANIYGNARLRAGAIDPEADNGEVYGRGNGLVVSFN